MIVIHLKNDCVPIAKRSLVEALVKEFGFLKTSVRTHGGATKDFLKTICLLQGPFRLPWSLMFLLNITRSHASMHAFCRVLVGESVVGINGKLEL